MRKIAFDTAEAPALAQLQAICSDEGEVFITANTVVDRTRYFLVIQGCREHDGIRLAPFSGVWETLDGQRPNSQSVRRTLAARLDDAKRCVTAWRDPDAQAASASVLDLLRARPTTDEAAFMPAF